MAVTAAKTQLLHAQALERVAPSYHPETVVVAPRLQQPILDGPCRHELLDPKGPPARGGGVKVRRRGPRLAGSLRERIVLKSWLPDSLKMESLARLDKVEKERAELEEEKLAELEGESRSEKRRRSKARANIPGFFVEGQQVMATRDLYLEGDHVMAAYMDKAVVLGPSRSSDPNRVCVQFEERRDGGKMWVNVMPDEVMSEENGRLMQQIKEKGRLSSKKLPPEEGSECTELLEESLPAESLELRVQPWTSSARLPGPVSPTKQGQSRMRDSHSLPALLGGRTGTVLRATR